MTSLRELQREFCAGILSDDPGRIRQWVIDAGIAPAQRLQIYRNNTRAGFLATMQASFPVIQRLSGEDWFAQSVRGYQRLFPSQSGDLQFVGERYAQHLRAELAATPHAYFEDVARLEWAYQEVLTAAPGAPFDPADLRAIDPQDHERIVFELRPDLRLVQSEFPLLTIWKANQPGAGDDVQPIRLDQGGQAVLLIRRADHVELREWPPLTAALLRQISNGAQLGGAVAAIVAAFPDFDLTQSLNHLLAAQCVAAVHIAEANS
jgi:hypothetical protein